MGFTEKLPSGKYRARWFDPTGRQRSKTFERERDAVRHVRNVQSDIDRGVYVNDISTKVTFGEWAEHYMTLADKRFARTSVARDRSYLDNHVMPRWGRVRLARINRGDIETWIAELSEPGVTLKPGGQTLAPATVEKIYQVFRKIIVAAVDDGSLPRNPCPVKVPIPRGKRKAIRFLDQTEIGRLATAIDERYEAMIYVAAYGGFRLGELCALRLDDIDWKRGTIRVDEGITDVNGHLAFEPPKTERAHRHIPLPDRTLNRLHDHIASTIDTDDRPRALLFTAPEGGPLRPTNWRKRTFNPAAKDAKLQPLTPHDLRHTAASLFIAAGANPWMLAEVLGHTDTRMIDRIYGHLYDEDRQLLRDAISTQAETTAAVPGPHGNVIRLPARRSRSNPKQARSPKASDRDQ